MGHATAGINFPSVSVFCYNQRMTTNDAKQLSAKRYEQAMVDADIEGMPRDAGYDALIAEMERKGLSTDAQIKRLTAYARQRQRTLTPAD